METVYTPAEEEERRKHWA